MNFSVIVQDPNIRPLVQEKLLERIYYDSLFPRLMYRDGIERINWEANTGDSRTWTGKGLIEPSTEPLLPGVDPEPASYGTEQWTSTMREYGNAGPDTPMPTSYAALASLFISNVEQTGKNGAQSLNRVVRNKQYNAAMSGHTVITSAVTASTTVHVQRLNGLTTARRPDLTNGSKVEFAPVSSSNPLKVYIYDNTGPSEVTRNIIGFTADNERDVDNVGPGYVTLDAAVTVSARAYLIADDRSSIVRVGGGLKIDDVGSSDLFKLSSLRAAVARARTTNVPVMPTGYYHFHHDPTTESQAFADDEFQRLNTSLPDYVLYREFAVSVMHGCIFFRNNESPRPDSVIGGMSAAFSTKDDFGGELYNNGATTGTIVHRPILIGGGGIKEYYASMDMLTTEAGLTGKVTDTRVQNDGIDVYAMGIKTILRAPVTRMQDTVSCAWKFLGAWSTRTDVLSGDRARYKRWVVIEHGE